MKKLLWLIPIILSTVLIGFLLIDSDEDVVYYIPHQDDETISFGVSIIDDIQEGKEVHIVLLTDGSASVVREILGLSKKEFTEARNKEMNEALVGLGVDLKNLTQEKYTDGELTVEEVEDVIQKYAEKYPDAEHKAFSFHDPHPDHSHSGKALKNMLEEGVVEQAKFYVGYNYDPPADLDIKESHYEKSYDSFIDSAIEGYSREDKENGFYGIGLQSVPDLFEHLKENPRSIYHTVDTP